MKMDTVQYIVSKVWKVSKNWGKFGKYLENWENIGKL
jgi:hypothetical protein